jgi:hypothetical protein
MAGEVISSFAQGISFDMRRRLALPLALAAGALVTACGSGGGSDFVIVAHGKLRARHVGHFHYFPATYRAAVAVFGKPSSYSIDAPHSNLCTAHWRSLDLAIGFASGMRPCKSSSLRVGTWYGMSMRGPRFRTDRGLQVGDSILELRRIYPQARLRFDGRRHFWSLLRERGDYGGVLDALVAHAAHGRVVSFEVPANYVY